jgi:hypothetical protein
LGVGAWKKRHLDREGLLVIDRETKEVHFGRVKLHNANWMKRGLNGRIRKRVELFKIEREHQLSKQFMMRICLTKSVEHDLLRSRAGASAR